MSCPYIVRIEKLEKWKEEHSLEYSKDRLESKHNMKSLVEAISANTKAQTAFAEEARGMMELHRDAVGLFRIGKNIQNFAASVTKWGLMATIVIYTIELIKSNMPSLMG